MDWPPATTPTTCCALSASGCSALSSSADSGGQHSSAVLYTIEPAAQNDAYLMQLADAEDIPTLFADPIDEEGEPAVPAPPRPLATMALPVVHDPARSQLEDNVNFPRDIGSVIAGRYEVTGSLGSGSFSHAVQCRDLGDGGGGDGAPGSSADGGDGEVCVKIVRNNKDFFDQSLSEVKILQVLNANDPDDARGILRLRAFFYHRERPTRSKRLAPPGARTVGPRPRLAPRERARRPLRSEARHGLVRSAHPLAPLQGRGVQLQPRP